MSFVQNPICDLPAHLTHDISVSNATSAKVAYEAEKILMAKHMEFGNIIADKAAYDNVLKFSPYHMPLDMQENRPISDLLITADESYKNKYHARKLIAKLREASMFDPMFAFYHEYPDQMYSEQQKMAEHYAFLINALLFNK